MGESSGVLKTLQGDFSEALKMVTSHYLILAFEWSSWSKLLSPPLGSSAI